jgi:bile acid-coenzyme A ligase
MADASARADARSASADAREAAAHVSLPARLRTLAAELPDERVLWSVAADGTEAVYTWAELDRRSSQVAGALAARGVGFGDRVGLGLRNSAQFVLVVFAAWKLGAVPVPMRWDLPEWELARLRDAIDGKVCLGEDDVAWIDATTARAVPHLPDVVAPQTNGICSSGSTGLPKVIVGNRPAVFNPMFTTPFVETWGRKIPRPQTVIVLGPMYHINGFHGVHSLLAGDRVVVMEKFDAARVVDVIERHRVSTFNCTPTMLKRIADLPDIDERDLSSIEWISQGAAPMPPYLVRRWAELIGPERLIMAYGMSEGLGLCAIRADEWMTHEGSVGRPVRGTEVRILDADRNDVPPRQIGDIYLRSASYGGSTYLGGASQAPTTDDGFTSVGDMGYLDEDGYLYLIDRRVDMIITGGANVFPAEVETALIDHPKVADIVVIGLKDDEWGRRVHAIVQPVDPTDPPTFDELRAYAKSRLHPFKVPKSVEIVDEIPRSAATKVNRGALVDARGG